MIKQLRYFYRLLLIFSFIATSRVPAQELKGFEFSGEVRLRSEFDDRDFDAGTSFYNNNLLRTRLNVKKHLSEKSYAVIQLQDSRVYGTEGGSPESGTRLSTANVDLHQAYVRLETFGFTWFAFQFGRMELSYGNQRLLSRNNWSNAGRSFDAVLSTISLKKATVDLFAASLYESQPNAFKTPPEDDGDVALYGLWMKLNPLPFGRTDLYVLHDRNFRENDSNKYQMLRSTVGTLVQGKLKGFNWSLETNYQFGKTAFTTDISAYYLIASAGYTRNSKYKPGFSLGYDYLSGDDPDTGVYETFNTLYPSRHRYFGIMDYIRTIPDDVKDKGVKDIHIHASLSPVNTFNLEVNVHFFRLDQKTVVLDNKTSTRPGTEMDVVCKYKMLKDVNFEGGVCAFQPDEVYKFWKGHDVSFWVYGQLSASL